VLLQRVFTSSLLLQAMAFLAGANSIFSGDKLLTTPNPSKDTDTQLFKVLGLKGRPAFLPYAAGEDTSKYGAAASL
jgi:biotin synthase